MEYAWVHTLYEERGGSRNRLGKTQYHLTSALNDPLCDRVPELCLWTNPPEQLDAPEDQSEAYTCP